jgi:hypothetical protein
LKRHGFSYENSQIARLGEETEVGTATPKKAAPKKTQGKANPASKKRKLEEDGEGSTGDGLDEMKEEKERA